MDAKRRRLLDDCRGHFRGELLLDEISRGLYATDASLFEIEPLGVAAPLDLEDLQFLVRYASDQQMSLIPRGAGTGVAGESLGPGLVIDLSIHFRQIIEVGTDCVRVQPGVVLRNLNKELALHGRRFAPDTASAASCTIGGMLATNASGSNVMMHGYTRDHVQSLRVVWDNGESDVLNSGQWAVGSGQPDKESGRRAESNGKPEISTGRMTEITKSVTELLEKNAELIRASQPKTPYNRCGYLLHDVLGPNGLDVPKVLVGSEGTLAVFGEATLKTLPLPGGRCAVLFAFDSLDASLRAAEHLRPLRPTACELLDRRLLTLTRSQSPEMARMIPSSAEAVLLCEFERDSQDDARQTGLEVIDLLQRLHHLAVLALPAFDEPSIFRLWQVREAALPALYSLSKGPRPLAFIEDIGIPPEALIDFLNRLQSILHRFETTASFMIHAATGQIHARPFLDLRSPADAEKLWAIADEAHLLAIDMGGTISTQHGTGIARTPWVEKQYGRLSPVFRELKGIFDPRGILNPGKIVGLDPSRPAWPLRADIRNQEPGNVSQQAVDKPGTAPPRNLLWQADELNSHISACNGCGACRTEQETQRMCPTFRVTHEEAAAPRAKANMLRRLLSATDDAKPLGADDVRHVADYCVNCKMCAHECPAHVDIPKLMLEAKAANHAEHGLDRSDWILSRIESAAALGSNFALVSNTILGNKTFRWLVEKACGLSRHRRLPEFAARSFLKRARRRGWTRKRRIQGDGPKLAYFVDLFPNVFDPLIAEAVVAVMHHHGFDVYIPFDQKACGMAPLSQGDVELAREIVQHNLRLFADLAREGYTILCSEPTAAIMLRQDALALIDDPDAQLVADHTEEVTSFLWRMHEEGRLRTDFGTLELSLGHHVPCHLKALGKGVHGPGLLSLIPGLKVHTIDVSCSGMAGTFGLKAKNFANSLEAGRPMLTELARPRNLFGSTECGTCRMQMVHGTGKRTLHPVQYLALAYGLLPEIGRKLREPLSDRMMT